MGLFELFIEDEVTASWITMNNTFAWPPPHIKPNSGAWPPPPADLPPDDPTDDRWCNPKQHREDKYWHGILVQLGKPKMRQSGAREIVVDKVVLMNTKDGKRVATIEEETLGQEPTYLVVESENGRISRPMDKPPERNPSKRPPSEDPWCGHSLHGNFDSYHGGILLWPDRDTEYEVRSFRRVSGGYHHSFRFILTSRGSFHLTAYTQRNGEWVPKLPDGVNVIGELDDVDRIEALVSRHAQGHGDPELPPMKP